MAKKSVYLTTKDNPYDPHNDFDSWYQFDLQKGYNTPGLLARFSCTSDEFTDEENVLEIERAIDTIIEDIDFMHMYEKLVYFGDTKSS